MDSKNMILTLLKNIKNHLYSSYNATQIKCPNKFKSYTNIICENKV